ncbi:hypothetical protein ROLI_038110 [Roseobacter fucihabitans]|uniref:Flagellar protein FliL n=1 Tax=Roseobacter fucihabitans TaxID=1537242 RepID=A0ABZ2C045_9RHOB|nr:flagellar basal body-associated FliL family protein [Roseobacter litoralis]MBC6967538.1 hypothetical protein [Roseobacter litoralis]
MKKLIPIIMLIIGSGAGVGAGIFMRPPPVEVHSEAPLEETEITEQDQSEAKAPSNSADRIGPSSEGMEYVKLPNQFVVPLVDEDRISAMVVMALSLEVLSGYATDVIDIEPKLRDEFLRVLFDHASIGGFAGAFINNENLDVIRRRLREVAKAVMGPEVVNDVLIYEIARQDY